MPPTALHRADEPTPAGFLCGLLDDEIRTVLSYTQGRRFSRGSFVIRRGESDRSLYIVTAGALEVLLITPNGPLSILELRSGDLFGEMAFFDGLPRSAGVRAIEDTEVLVMTPDGFERLRLAEPRLAVCFLMELGCILSARVRAGNQRLVSAPAATELAEGVV